MPADADFTSVIHTKGVARPWRVMGLATSDSLSSFSKSVQSRALTPATKSIQMSKPSADNASSCTFSVTVRDTTPPSVTCPADVAVKSLEAEGAAVTFTPATASDGVTTSPRLTYSHASGSVFPQGTTPVTATARDEAGLTAERTFQVTVRRPTTVPVPDEPIGFGCSSGGLGNVGGGAWLLLMGSVLFLQQCTLRAWVVRGACAWEAASTRRASAAYE
ncbi:HYR domain-containing protein [Pyxidicoccus xibeiensis]|uniref:HYR domain-containing protein n=1 Tax=Pyxidicoccus xibeiensis TaxID=2906759 RepID=UPI0020A733EF|nr:HYR domain-containing protein [Pyxidicoccus xibeiensis]MCP3136630.1 HYR domain-containing protein [Pyxidicoccus xibeiensis]